jgi:hypothetical protein
MFGNHFRNPSGAVVLPVVVFVVAVVVVVFVPCHNT